MPLDPIIAQLLEMGRDQPAIETLSVEMARANMEMRVELLKSFAPADVQTGNLEIPSADGPLPARLYHPPGGAAPHPVLVWLHGGGWVVGSLESHDNLCRALAKSGDLLVLAIDYRLAPEHKSPAQQRDAIAALDWAAAHIAGHGGNPSRLIVGGDSAGGNLAALAALETRGRGPKLAGQLLVYPVADVPADNMASYAENELFGLSRAAMQWFWDHWLPAGADADASTAPLRAADLGGLPPAYVVTAEYDVLRDEGVAYARRLEAAGVPTVHDAAPGMIHGFFSMTGLVPAATEGVARAARWAAGLKATA
jgi:acetyl esterase